MNFKNDIKVMGVKAAFWALASITMFPDKTFAELALFAGVMILVTLIFASLPIEDVPKKHQHTFLKWVVILQISILSAFAVHNLLDGSIGWLPHAAYLGAVVLLIFYYRFAVAEAAKRE